ncbi:Uma2 family endonuclease [Arcicella aurantiaca]|uniref:Uma2 family endonuclease n=1 Tax=Arcicella aurantiaca TaxID=591202 RepID=A0A316EHS5_9BACT|nr:Uma2 family endonuclease [Arcicella aurantiaca]PWK28353.1 Uma2 family endonuclease [Arcicella aurantiaca]
MSNPLISELLKEPDAYLIIQEIENILEDEKARRIAFYNDITEQEKVEFINGEIIVHSPVMKRHNTASLLLAQLMNVYNIKHQLGFVGIEKIMITLTRNDYEPDICFFRKEKSESFTEKQTLFPTPDFVIEILSKGTKDRGRGVKFKDYQAHQIEEYWIIDPDHQTIEQYHYEEGQYELLLKSSEGNIKSLVMTGFQIPIQSVFDEKINLETLKKLM